MTRNATKLNKEKNIQQVFGIMVDAFEGLYQSTFLYVIDVCCWSFFVFSFMEKLHKSV